MADASDNHKPSVVLVTGGAGFIGCNFVRHLLSSDESLRVINYDALTYAGSQANLAGLQTEHADRYRFVHADIRDEDAVSEVFAGEPIDTIVHLAAESHVDRSINAPGEFLSTNITGTYVLLQAARKAWSDRADVRFHHVSTDEVYGSLGSEGLFTETTPYDPSSPYSASKAASDHLVRAWCRTYGLPVTISNCSNNYGPYQFPEKLLPLMITNALAGKPLPVYGDGKNVRDWLFVEDHCSALDTIVRRGKPGATYNVGGCNEWANIDIVNLLCDQLQDIVPPDHGHYRDLITFVTDRPGHDRRYAIDASLIESELGWTPQHQFEGGLRETIEWHLANEDWIEEIRRTKYAGQRLGVADDK
ncbi:MAG: dTDP-glucose 4,6-dehydratase [Phycisphaerae bacterium]|jgi:dTDP-glucose 4,6-dehydratase|nr:dTDP-glucose 4,6-dehydratase [Phycisphaerae bacterium]